MLEALLYSYTFCSLIFKIVIRFIFPFSFKCSVLKLCCMHLTFLFVYFKMCICSIYKVFAFSFGSVFVVLILQSIASVVLIFKSIWIKCKLNVNIYCVNIYIYIYNKIRKTCTYKNNNGA